MGIEALITLATQIGGATGSALTGGGFATGAASTAANAATFGATGAAASTGILGTGIGAGVTGTQVAALGTTAASVMAATPSQPKNLQTKDKEIKTNVGDEVSGKRKRRSVASTVQGGNKRNSLS